MIKRLVVAAALLPLATAPAFAHPGTEIVNSFAGGFFHPLTGLDHILAMVAVGLWAAQQGGKALWAWPLTFVSIMVLGGVLGTAGISLPLVEPAILASILILGLLVTFAVRLPVYTGALIVGAFAVMHGHAHGTEMGAHAPILFAAGFVAATALLHSAGLTLALVTQQVTTKWGVRIAGAATAALGLSMVFAG